MKKVLTAVAIMALAGSAAHADDADSPLKAGGDAANGEELAGECSSCHGSDGNSPDAQWPNIAGQHAGYLFKQLRNFKDGEQRANSQMEGIVAELDEDDMRDLSAFYSDQPRKIMGAEDEERVERGRAIYLGGIPDKGVAACAACHGPRGEGNAAAGYPVVGGQWAQYLIDQLEQFRSGDRGNDSNETMRALAEEMSDDDIRAVAEYMAGLH